MVLLIGATGLLGHNLLKLLLEKGTSVRCIVRRGSTLLEEVTSLAKTGQLELVTGSPLDEALLKSAMAGCSAVVNCAGITDMTLPSIDDYRPLNTGLPLMIASFMEEAVTEVFVEVSTANTIAPGTRENPSDESAPFGGPFTDSLYARSKKEAEDALMQFGGKGRIVIVNPGFMVGPYDVKPSSGALLLASYKKPVMVAPDGGKSFVDVRDVAAAILGAIENTSASGRYLLTGEAMTFREFYTLQAGVCGYKQKFLTPHEFTAKAFGYVGDTLARLGIHNIALSHNIRQMLIQEFYDNSRARDELAMPSTPISESIRDFFDERSRRLGKV